MGLEGFVSLLVSPEFLNVVEVISSNDDGSVHLVGHYETFVQFSSNGWNTSEWAFVINVVSFNGFFWNFETCI